MKGGSNMNPAQASGATLTYGRRMALTSLLALTVASSSKPQPPASQASQAVIARIRRAAALAACPPSEDEIQRFDVFLRERGERLDGALDERGALSRDAVRAFVIASQKRERP
jgi:hypothetical protein